jgi:hypothetical protein
MDQVRSLLDHFIHDDIDPISTYQLREILDQSSMTRLLGPGSSVFAAPHSGFAVWDQAIEGVKPGTIGRPNQLNNDQKC